MPGADEHTIRADGLSHLPIVFEVTDDQHLTRIDCVSLQKRPRPLDLATGQEVLRPENGFEIRLNTKMPNEAFELVLLAGRYHGLPNTGRGKLFKHLFRSF
ncbi:hypothetical protein SDC9_150051 [bioreactor metagenome]|uniref:Uncharacterized protein n=1 Tax=bioreactor metagenome TaxID=1076179 RepID=A0A645EQN0_9ZZZZ